MNPGWGHHSEDVPLSRGRASRGKLIPSPFPQHQSSHQRPCTQVTLRDRKTGWAVALGATLKKDQRLSATDIGGGDRGAGWGISPRRQSPHYRKKKKKPQAWRLASFLSQAHGLFHPRQGRGHLVGLFRYHVQLHSGKLLSSQLEPHVHQGLGVAKEQP